MAAISQTQPVTGGRRPHVVIVGAGFGGLAAARGLGKAPVDVTIVDERNHHLFQPLLYQVATAALAPSEIAWPIRAILREQENTTVLLDKVTGVDTENRRVSCDTCEVPYDYLILATGSRHAYFGHDEWEPYAPGLKTVEDATAIRRRILMAFERAETEPDPARRARLLTFVIVGGGPTGVELAGAIAELAKMALASDFRHIDPQQTRVVLVEAADRVLPPFPATLSRFAARALDKLGVEVRLGQPITKCDAEGVMIGEERLAAATVLWAAGVAASPASEWLGAEHDKAGRVLVEPDLTVPGHPEIFVVGDTAHVEDEQGKLLPGIAPVAKQQGDYAAAVVRARVAGAAPPPPFRYRDRGELATIGRKAAVIKYRRLELKGRLAWWIWGLAHIYFLITMRDRLIVGIRWLWAYFTFERGSRLITEPHP